MSEYGFEEDVDFTVMDIFVHNLLGGRQNQTDHAKEKGVTIRSVLSDYTAIAQKRATAQKRARTYEQINRICIEEIRNHIHNEDKLMSQIATLVQSPNLDSANFLVESCYLEFLDQSVILRSDDF
ncbi:antA/AntB antirepressor family protein [Staphylococcus chromogenes]|uniref:antA/AntB antirepressor family protein n=1 Tax=Staphylococcus chromogenes TaxID=46126 RepID=UPI001E389477|nr:antA/AntB antirepressor family protein [Staphylococcus chromogenes]MCD8905025.1 antA/AntB antirepressor family protein [Staphylococcus chromogenes]